MDDAVFNRHTADAQQTAYRSINKAMLGGYWLVGKRIIQEEQQGEARAAYGAAIIKTLSEQLQREFGKGFSIRNIEQMRLFYLEYPIAQTVPAQLDIQDNSGISPDKLRFPEATALQGHNLLAMGITHRRVYLTGFII